MTDEPELKHTYPEGWQPGAHWATNEAWRCLDKLKPGLISDDVRAFIVGYMAAALEKAHDAGLERAAAYHDQEARDCRAIAAVNEDNELGPDCTDYAIQHDADAEAIRALAGLDRYEVAQLLDAMTEERAAGAQSGLEEAVEAVQTFIKACRREP